MEIVYGGLLALLVSVASIMYLKKNDEVKENTAEAISRKRKTIQNILIIVAGLVIGIGYELLLVQFEYGQLQILRLIFISCLMIPIGVIDYREHLIHNRLLLYALGARGIFFIIEAISSFKLFEFNMISGVAGAFISMVILLVCRALSKNSIGMGDIKLFGILGTFFGTDILGVMMISFAACAVCNIFGLITKKKKKKDLVALAPYVAAGVVITIVIG